MSFEHDPSIHHRMRFLSVNSELILAGCFYSITIPRLAAQNGQEAQSGQGPVDNDVDPVNYPGITH